MSAQTPLGEVLSSLFETIQRRKDASPEESYTASLLAAGAERCAKKFGEEAVEAALAGAVKDKAQLTEEAADVLYHLFVLMAATDVSPEDVARALTAREGQSGHAEKASRKSS